VTNQKRKQVSRPSLTRELVLKTVPTQRSYEYVGQKLMRAFVSADIVLRVLGLDKEVEQLTTLVENKLIEIDQSVDKKIETLEALVKQYKLTDRSDYSAPLSLKVEIQTPWAGRYLSLLQKMDEALQLQDMIWLHGYMATQSRIDEEKEMTRALNSFANLVVRTVIKAKKKSDKSEDDKVKDLANVAVEDATDAVNAANGDEADEQKSAQKKAPAKKSVAKKAEESSKADDNSAAAE